MAYFNKDTVTRWNGLAREWLADNTELSVNSITIGSDAWTVAHRSGIMREAYADRNAVDAHIQTALAQIFPNVVFKDAKKY